MIDTTHDDDGLPCVQFKEEIFRRIEIKSDDENLVRGGKLLLRGSISWLHVDSCLHACPIILLSMLNHAEWPHIGHGP